MTSAVQIWDIERVSLTSQHRTEVPPNQKRSFGSLASSILSGSTPNHNYESYPPNDYLTFSIPQAHDRGITDFGWSPQNENVLATCSADTTIRIWDIRTPSNTSQRGFRAFVGTSILKWHPTENKIATAHDGEVRIWDVRKQGYHESVQLITAHAEALTSMDWNPSRTNELLTTAQDHFIKLWNVNFNSSSPK